MLILFLFANAFSFLQQFNLEGNPDDSSTNDPEISPSATPSISVNKGLSATWLIVIVVSVIVLGSILITILVFWIVKKAKTKYGHDLEENLMGSNVNAFHQS